MEFKGKVAVITGGAGGIGRAVSLALARQGATSVVVDVDEAGAQSVALEASKFGVEALSVAGDVSQTLDFERTMASIIARVGRIDILINNAADLHSARTELDILHADYELWDRTFRTNLLAVVAAAKSVLPHMIGRGSGNIINVSSVASLNGDVVRHAYGATKAGLNLLTRSIATTYGKSGVRCNCVCPGVTRSPEMIAGLSEPIHQALLRNILTDSLATFDEVAEVVVFLASDRSRSLMGQIITADCGLTAHLQWYATNQALPGKTSGD